MTIYVDPGELRTELSLEECRTVYDAHGGFSEDWLATATVFAKIEPVGAKSTFDADQTLETITHRIYVRWQSGLSSGMRFRSGERLFDLLTIHDPDETGRYLVCTAVEKGA